MNGQTENALEGHTCSYYCHHPRCIRAQRDELRDQMEKRIDYAVKSAVEGEREECAKLCEKYIGGNLMAMRIRAKGKVK